jgi:hypothetical protein
MGASLPGARGIAHVIVADCYVGSRDFGGPGGGMFHIVAADHAFSAQNFNEPILTRSLSIRVVHALCMTCASKESA